MATLLQVLQTLTSLTATACYPNGTGQPSITTRQITIESGYPIRTQQDVDLGDGFSHVYVYPTDKERVVTKFQRIYQPMTKESPTLVLTVLNDTITVSGTVTVPQAVMIIVNGVGYGYQVLISDTLNTIATNIVALIPGASAMGSVITIPNAYSLDGRITTAYSAAEELSRSERVFGIYVASPNFTDRATIIDAIDVYLKQNYRITLPDDFVGMVFYNNTIMHDDLEHYTVYKGWLSYMIQYPTTITNQFTSITDPFYTLAVNE